MRDRLAPVAEAARAYCEVISETTATPVEMVTGGRYVARMLDLRNRRELAYVEMAQALRTAGYAPARPMIDETDAVIRRQQAGADAHEEAERVLAVMRATAAGRWPPAYPGPEYVDRVSTGDGQEEE